VKTSSDGECFLAENNLKGNATARWALFTTEFEWSQPCKVERKRKTNQFISAAFIASEKLPRFVV
jgi:hypothetical protein